MSSRRRPKPPRSSARSAPFATPNGSHVLRIIGLAGIITNPESEMHVGAYVETYDPEAAGGRGSVTTTGDVRKAARFPNAGAAMECWRFVPRAMSTRYDGAPNRPLTAFTVEVVGFDDALAGRVTPV